MWLQTNDAPDVLINDPIPQGSRVSPAAPGEHVLVLYQHPGGSEPLGHGDHLLHVGDAGRGALQVKVDDPVLGNVRLTGSLGDNGRNPILVPIGLIIIREVDGSVLEVDPLLDPLIWRLNHIVDHRVIILDIVIVPDVLNGFVLCFESIDEFLLVVYFL